MPSRRFSLFAWGVLAYNLAVILWGAYVRATGSGAGCGSHWPLCNGEVVPRAPSTETLIEYSHRITSGLALLAIIALVIWAWRLFPGRHPVRRAAAASLALVLLEAAIGAGLVLFEMVADNETMARAMFMAVHLANTFLLLAALALTASWSAREEVRPWRSRGPWLLWAGLAGLVLTGMSGAVSALGDTLYPAASLAEGLRQDLSATSQLLIRLRVLHPAIAVAAGLALLVLARRQLEGSVTGERGSATAESLARGLMLAVLVQMAGGVLNVALLAPVWMQLTHLLLADGVWILLVLLGDALLAEAPAAAAHPAGRRSAELSGTPS